MTPLDIAGKTDPGKVRERNEDSISLVPELGLLVVADGMGGHNSGEVASGLAVDTITTFARDFLGKGRNAVPEGSDASLSARARQLTHFIQNANTVIFEKSRAFKKDQGMGTTVVAALADEKSLTVAHVGDSRLYLLRGGRIERLTEDHSLVQDQVRHGLITPEQAEKSHLQNILTRALGTEAQVRVDVSDHPVLPGDVYMLCSDGLTKMVTEAEMAGVLLQAPTAAAAVDTLIRMANEAGGVDNVTVAVARADAAPKGGWRGIVSRFLGG
ncbi:MAG: Stp1/IreP family PP2C-type Ser/Thr phosphatase [Elusimicrobia bacterium]|nr:Stp1/IreP family PP2C-type Ser/Thr phosphatase [Elusimicrobiota bacterium]